MTDRATATFVILIFNAILSSIVILPMAAQESNSPEWGNVTFRPEANEFGKIVRNMSVNNREIISLLLLVCSNLPCLSTPLTGSQRPILRGLSETADAIQDMSNLGRHFDFSGKLQSYHQ